MGPWAHWDVDILRTVSLGNAEWRRARIHGHVVVIRVSAVWASQRGFAPLVSTETDDIIVALLTRLSFHAKLTQEQEMFWSPCAEFLRDGTDSDGNCDLMKTPEELNMSMDWICLIFVIGWWFVCILAPEPNVVTATFEILHPWFYESTWNEIATHQVGAEPVIDRLHRLARAVEMDGAVMAVGFKGGAWEVSQREKVRFSATVVKIYEQMHISKAEFQLCKRINCPLNRPQLSASGTLLDALLGYN